jgi:hypothetical protein
VRNLLQRLEALEAQAGLDRQQCPEHWALVIPELPIDYRALLAPFSPDPEERAQYERDRQTQRCVKCGWEPIRIIVSEEWPHHGRMLE